MFAVFTYIAPLLQDITGFAEHNVTWILVIFGCGVTLGNMIGGKLADWKLMPSLLGLFLAVAVILGIFTFTVHSPALAVITIFLWGMASFGVMPGMQVRIMNLAKRLRRWPPPPATRPATSATRWAPSSAASSLPISA
ncbi:hypothetical protein HMSSN036_38810 [Paenibacillus macerans]|nr:hypothetical protein HMSSN036_38810 [Paenibacillus macerans]